MWVAGRSWQLTALTSRATRNPRLTGGSHRGVSYALPRPRGSGARAATVSRNPMPAPDRRDIGAGDGPQEDQACRERPTVPRIFRGTRANGLRSGAG